MLKTLILHNLEQVDRRKIYNARIWIANNSDKVPESALTNFLRAFNWSNPKEVTEARRLMLRFNSSIKPEHVLILLDERFTDPIVRLFAIQHISTL